MVRAGMGKAFAVRKPDHGPAGQYPGSGRASPSSASTWRRRGKVNPRLVEAALAEISLLPSTALSQRARLIDQALKTEPENANLLSARSKLYASVGRLNDAIR